jgi:hypothetical protein
MPNMSLIAKAAMDYTTTVLNEYPDAATGGLGVSVNLPTTGATYTVTITPALQVPPAPEEQLLTPPADTPVSAGDDK